MGDRIADVISIYVDRSNQQWVVRDRQGALWILPQTKTPWEHRQPFHPTEETELERVPKHYEYLLWSSR